MSRKSHVALRTCIGCRTVRPYRELVRLVVGPDGSVLVDLDRKLPGRGAHVCPKRSCVLAASKRNVLERAFRRPVEVPRNGFLIEALCERLEVKLAGLLGRAQRARKVTSGTLALELSLKKGEVCMVLAARDMGSEQFRRLSSLAESCRCPLVSYFTKDELGHLLGKGQRSAAGITNAEIAESVRRVITTIWDLKGGEEGKTRGV